MSLATSYPLLEVFWTILIFFGFVVWIWILFTMFADLFRRQDIGGWTKTAWIIFVVIFPFLGVFVYVIAQHKGMQRTLAPPAGSGQARNGPVRPLGGRQERPDPADRQGRGAAQSGRDHAGRVRPDQETGAGG